MAISVIMPALEMAQETGKILSWRKKEGDRVSKGEALLEIETDKAVVEIEATGEGILAGVIAAEGAVVAVGQTIAWLVQPGEAPPKATLEPQSGRHGGEPGLDTGLSRDGHADLAEDRIRRRDRVERQERLERVEVDLAPRERAQLRRELEHIAGVAVVQRLDPVAIARQHEPPSLAVPDRHREHPTEPPHVLGAIARVEVEMDLGVAMRPEDMALAFELPA